MRSQAVTDDVVEFLALQLQKLPANTQEVLKLAACIGNQFDLETLAIVRENSQRETASELWKALQEGLILPVSQVYKFYQDFGKNQEIEGLPITHNELAKYKFLHDRVQQAAYSLIPEERKRATHLKIGQLLLSKGGRGGSAYTEVEREERIFDIINHLNVGAELITEEAERVSLAQLNLIAGKKAKAATAYSAAAEYFKVGRELLTDSLWQRQYQLSLELYQESTEISYLSGDFVEMDRLAEIVLQTAQSLLEKVKIYEILIQAYVAQNQLEKAFAIALSVLNLLGIRFPERPQPSDIEDSIQQTQALLAERSIHELVNLPSAILPETLAAMQILSGSISIAFVGFTEFLPLFICELVNLSVRFGNTPLSTLAYAYYGMLLCGIEEIESGYQFGLLTSDLVTRLDARAVKRISPSIASKKETITGSTSSS